jgi:hypothetical protein
VCLSLSLSVCVCVCCVCVFVCAGNTHAHARDIYTHTCTHTHTLNRCRDSVSSKCTTCKATTVCYDGQVEGNACGFTFTPHSAGFFRITILTPSQTGGKLTNIQGSPFRLHVDDGALFLPGVSVGGFLFFFLVSVLGAAALICMLLSMAWSHWKASQPQSEYEQEMLHLEQIAAGLETTAQRRQENSALLAHLPFLSLSREAEAEEEEDASRGRGGAGGDTAESDEETPPGPLNNAIDTAHALNAALNRVLPLSHPSNPMRRRAASHSAGTGKGGDGGEGGGEEYLAEAVSRGVRGLADMVGPMVAIRQVC